MREKLLNFSFELYDLDSSITLEIAADTIVVNFNDNNKQISLWMHDGDIYPEIKHDLIAKDIIPLDVVLKVLEIANRYLMMED